MSTPAIPTPHLGFSFGATAFTSSYNNWAEADRADFGEALTHARISAEIGDTPHPAYLATSVLNEVTAPASPWIVAGMANPNVTVTVHTELSVDNDGVPNGIYLAASLEAFTADDVDTIDDARNRCRSREATLVSVSTPAARHVRIFLAPEWDCPYDASDDTLPAMLNLGRAIADVINEELQRDRLFYRAAMTSTPHIDQLAGFLAR
jgi:hypothetical protein